MQLIEDTHEGRYQLQAYDAKTGEFTINGKSYNSNLILSADTLIEKSLPNSPEQLEQQHIEAALALKPEIIVVGTGNKIIQPNPALVQLCYSRQVGIEVMDTAAACRTLSLLLAENRIGVGVLFTNQP
jgi:uncharacterized protein